MLKQAIAELKYFVQCGTTCSNDYSYRGLRA